VSAQGELAKKIAITAATNKTIPLVVDLLINWLTGFTRYLSIGVKVGCITIIFKVLTKIDENTELLKFTNNKTNFSVSLYFEYSSIMESVLDTNKPATGKPKWLRVKLPTGKKYTELRGLVDKYKLHTICTSGSCPNMGECWGEGTATFMILGNICTRSCGFCGVKTGRPETVDWDEPEKVARSIKLMNIQHAVLTSVDRDDLKDGGSIIWAETVKAVRRMSPGTTMETLIPDFQGIERNID